MDNWISVKDKLPRPHEKVIIFTINGLYLFDSITINGNWKNERNEYVAYWQPLPPPPQKE